ncbi:hypothetical protein RCL_jg12840.t1 [Rhizophagus clarus]|uniref:SAM domain-containing protein n=1 Tax=Rhizophagus clarus TaxID=94130 RepID=A0A8H3QG59_9GLOM|nr:hypothetical protein RCL_jg12840.t1 [Rhizophagus clarus]
MIYKAENHCGAGNWLDNEDELASHDLDEISHDDFKSSVHQCGKNKIQEENINKVEVLILLRDKYQCTAHNNKYCYVESDRHLNLTTVNNEADFDNLPCGLLFNMTNSTKVSKNSQMTSSTYPLTHMPLTIQYLQPFFQPHTTVLPISTQLYYIYTSQPSPIFTQSQSQSQSLQNISKVVPELKEFLDGLNAIYGTGKYTQYFEIFEKHDIKVNLIPKISNEWWENKLQITSLGYVLTLKKEASKYIN